MKKAGKSQQNEGKRGKVGIKKQKKGE